MRHVYWPSPCGVGGEAGYTGQEDLKFTNSCSVGEGRTMRAWPSCSCIPRPCLVLPAPLSLGHHRAASPFPFRLPQMASAHKCQVFTMFYKGKHSECYMKVNIVNVWNFTYYWNSMQGNGPGIYIFI